MKQLICEMCGSTDLMKHDGVFVCQTCGCKYSVEEARKMMVEGTVEVTGTVRVDNTAAIQNYLDMANSAIEARNYKEADEYCNRIIEIDTTNWEAWFIKGKAVGWQSTLANIRIVETIHTFSKALEFCPEENKKWLSEACKQELDNLHSALLTLRTENFKTHPNKHDLQGLESDIRIILDSTIAFYEKSKILVDAENAKYGRIIGEGLCDAMRAIYLDYVGDNGRPGDYEFRKLLSEGDIIIEAFKLVLILLGTAYDDEDRNSVTIQIYKNMIWMQTTLRDACSYECRHFYIGRDITEYAVHLYLSDEAKALRNNKIAQWTAKIQEIQTVGPQKVAEAKQKKLDQYWAEHPDEKERLENEKGVLLEEKKQLDWQMAALQQEKDSVPSMNDLISIQRRIASLQRKKDNLGFFKRKEKKALQERIDIAKENAAEIQQVVDSQQADVESRMAPICSRLDVINNRISEIDAGFGSISSQPSSDNASPRPSNRRRAARI